MAAGYDICVDYDTLCDMEDKLKKIEYDLHNSSDRMVEAIRSSQSFLAGNQFEKAKMVTTNCIAITRQTGNNVRYAIEYIIKLRSVLEEYGRCNYNKGAK